MKKTILLMMIAMPALSQANSFSNLSRNLDGSLDITASVEVDSDSALLGLNEWYRSLVSKPYNELYGITVNKVKKENKSMTFEEMGVQRYSSKLKIISSHKKGDATVFKVKVTINPDKSVKGMSKYTKNFLVEMAQRQSLIKVQDSFKLLAKKYKSGTYFSRVVINEEEIKKGIKDSLYPVKYGDWRLKGSNLPHIFVTAIEPFWGVKTIDPLDTRDGFYNSNMGVCEPYIIPTSKRKLAGNGYWLLYDILRGVVSPHKYNYISDGVFTYPVQSSGLEGNEIKNTALIISDKLNRLWIRSNKNHYGYMLSATCQAGGKKRWTLK